MDASRRSIWWPVTLPAANTKVICEDPVYHGLLRVFARSGCQVLSVPVDADGLISMFSRGLLRSASARAALW